MPEPIIAIVVAAAENGVIGRAGKLPWRMPSDLRSFRRMTLGKPVIMGRKTFQSIGRALDGRANIVVTRDPAFRPAGAEVAGSLEDALSQARRAAVAGGSDEIMVIGGAEIFRAAMPVARRLYLTRIHAVLAGETVFPDPAPGDWRECRRQPIPPDPRDEHRATLLVYERIGNPAP